MQQQLSISKMKAVVEVTFLYVDDMWPVNVIKRIQTCTPVYFANKKKLCYKMFCDNKWTQNGIADYIPTLAIDEGKEVLLVTEVNYLGDICNCEGNK